MKIYIFIKEELRGNGYGKILFGKILEEIKKEGFEKVTHIVPLQSLQDVFSFDELYSFDERMKKFGDNIKYVVEKMESSDVTDFHYDIYKTNDESKYGTTKNVSTTIN